MGRKAGRERGNSESDSAALGPSWGLPHPDHSAEGCLPPCTQICHLLYPRSQTPRDQNPGLHPQMQPFSNKGELGLGGLWIVGFHLRGRPAHLFFPQGAQRFGDVPRVTWWGRMEPGSLSQALTIVQRAGGCRPAGSGGARVHIGSPTWPGPSREQPNTPICPGHPPCVGECTARAPGEPMLTSPPRPVVYPLVRNLTLPGNRADPTPGRTHHPQTPKSLGELEVSAVVPAPPGPPFSRVFTEASCQRPQSSQKGQLGFELIAW